MTGETEAILVERLRHGEAEALEALMTEYAPRIYRLAHGITRNEADAEEVVQDVFLRAFRRIDSFEGRSGLGTWLYRVTTNAALGKRRGKRAQVECSLEDWLPAFREDGHREGDRSLLLADWTGTPEAALLSHETQRAVRDAIDQLPDAYRVVLLLRDMEELPNEAIAAVLGESLTCVKSRLHRARMALRELLTRTFAAGAAGAGLASA